MEQGKYMDNDAAQLGEVTDKLYSELISGAPPIKVARLIVDALGMIDDRQEVLVQSALNTLCTFDDILVFGDIQNWRRSEIAKS